MIEFYAKYDVFLTSCQFWQLVAVSAFSGAIVGLLLGMSIVNG